MGLMGVPNPEDLTNPVVLSLLQNGIVPFKIPDEILKLQMSGLDWYDIEFISPATRIMNNEELSSTLKFLSVMGEAAAINQDFLDVIDADGTAQKLKDLTATDSIVVTPIAVRKQIREQRAKMQMEMMQLEAQAKMAVANQSNAQAAAARSGAVRNMMETGIGGG